MNNYLASIVARTLNSEQPVRPRLRGQFDPAGEGLTSAAPLDRAAPWDAETEQPTAPALAVSRAQGAEPAAAMPPADRAIAPHAPPSARAASQPSRLREPERAPQPEPDDLQSIRQRLDAIASLKAMRSSPEEGRERVITASPDNSVTPQAAAPPPPPVFAHTVIPAPRQVTERLADDESPTPWPAVMKSVVERETRTVILRDKRSLNDGLPRRDGAAPPQATVDRAPQTEASRLRESAAAPPTAHSHIAPLAEFAYENLPLRPTRVQPPPTIRVTIGRIEVRAVQTPPSPAKPRTTQPVMSLDDYLRRRGQGSVR